MGFSCGEGRRDQASRAGAGFVEFKSRARPVDSQKLRRFAGAGEESCAFSFGLFSPPFAPDYAWEERLPGRLHRRTKPGLRWSRKTVGMRRRWSYSLCRWSFVGCAGTSRPLTWVSTDERLLGYGRLSNHTPHPTGAVKELACRVACQLSRLLG
ncbi:unnamed protein product [Ectocarpus sp. 12 AP-2014]